MIAMIQPLKAVMKGDMFHVLLALLEPEDLIQNCNVTNTR